MKQLNVLQWEAEVRCYGEFMAYSTGERDCILIDNEKLKFLKYKYIRKNNKYTSIIFRYKKDVDLYDKLLKEYNDDYANGICLAFPPKVVKWYSFASHDEHIAGNAINFRSWQFNCPTFLLDYVKEYYTKRYGIHNVKKDLKIITKEERRIKNEANRNFTNRD